MKISINSDPAVVEKIRRALNENGGYCPCKLARTPETKCICEDFRRMKEGTCHCGLYTKTWEEGDPEWE